MNAETNSEHRRSERAARLRGIHFLAEHALVCTDAYALHVGPGGVVSVQGERGALGRLVDMLGSSCCEVAASQAGMREWQASVSFEGGTVLVELTETEP